MKKSPVFSKLLLAWIIGFLCVGLTIALALWAGSSGNILPEPGALNWGNIIFVAIIGGLVCCLVVGIMLLLFGKSLFEHIKDSFSKNDKNGGHQK